MFERRRLPEVEIELPDAHRVPSYAFIDADNVQASFKKQLIEYGISDDEQDAFSLHKLFQIRPHDRCYVYSATMEGDPTPDWLNEFRYNSGFILKLGILTKKGKTKKQEGVDVKLAIDATRLSFTGTLKTCTLYGGDGDFVPLVEAVTDSGAFVHIASFNDPKQGRVAPRLQAAADVYHKMDSTWIYRTLDENRKTVRRTPGRIHEWEASEIHKFEDLPDGEVELRQFDSEWTVRLEKDSAMSVYSSHKYDDLLLWLKFLTSVK